MLHLLMRDATDLGGCEMFSVSVGLSKEEILDTLVHGLGREELLDFMVEVGRRVGDHAFFRELCDRFAAEVEASRGFEVGDVVIVVPGYCFGGMEGVVRGFRGDRVVVELAYPGEPSFNLVVLPEKLSRV